MVTEDGIDVLLVKVGTGTLERLLYKGIRNQAVRIEMGFQAGIRALMSSVKLRDMIKY